MHVIDKLDLVLIMSVNPGFGGQSFIPHALDKLRAARKLVDMAQQRTGRPILLEVDGGVKVTTSRRLRARAPTRSFRAAPSSAHRITLRRSRRCGQPWPCYSRTRELRPQLAQGRVALAAPLLILRVPRRAQTTRATPR
jgi:hypothetical protein